MPSNDFMLGELNILLWGATGRDGTRCPLKTVWFTLRCVQLRSGRPLNLKQAIAYLRRELGFTLEGGDA